MEEVYYGIYHRPTNSWAKDTPLSLFTFKQDGSPRIFKTKSSAKRTITNFIKYCKQNFQRDLEFCIGLEVVELRFQIGNSVFQQIFHLDKINEI